MSTYPGYKELEAVLMQALEQAAEGKGKERHARGRPFEEQPILSISRLLDTADGLRYQVIKKVQESQKLKPEAARRELLGAIVYLAGAIIHEDNKP